MREIILMSNPGNTFPNPWQFDNADKCMASPSGKYAVEYGDLTEVGQGGALQGGLYIKNLKSGKRAKVFELAGGPPVWNKKGDMVVVPIWWTGCLIGRKQKLLVVDFKQEQLIIYKQNFKLLLLNKFEGGKLTGEQYKGKQANPWSFDTNTEKVLFRKNMNGV